MASTTTVGLDIGSTAIRAAEVQLGRSGPVVTNVGWVPLPAGAVSGGVVHDEDAVTAALRQLWASARIRTKRVVLGVTNRQLVVREMSVANVPVKELRKTLPFQVRPILPLQVEQSLLDFYPLENPGTNKTVRGLLIAAPKEAVLTAIRATERAGLYVGRVDLASFALLRAASRLDTKVEALVDIGAQTTNVVVHADGGPLIVRTIPTGGAEITETIAKRLSLPLPEAEAVKCRVGLRAVAGQEHAAVVRAVRPLFNEIRSSFAYLTTGDQQILVSRLSVCGGSAMMPGLPDALSADLGVDVVMADPTSRVRGPKRGTDVLDQVRGSAAVCIGLALGKAA